MSLKEEILESINNGTFTSKTEIIKTKKVKESEYKMEEQRINDEKERELKRIYE